MSDHCVGTLQCFGFDVVGLVAVVSNGINVRWFTERGTPRVGACSPLRGLARCAEFGAGPAHREQQSVISEPSRPKSCGFIIDLGFSRELGRGD